jgi:hydrogenase maturation factor HypF (carbamoyltransferase family)
MTNYYYDVNVDTNCTNCGGDYSDAGFDRSTNALGEYVDWCDECDDEGDN